MLLLANLLNAIAQCLDLALGFVFIIVIAHAVLSWVSPDPNNTIVRFINSICDPLLRPIQQKVPMFGRIDLSPIILIVIIYFLKFFVVQTMVDYSSKIRASEMNIQITQDNV
ncbi:MAG: YggT family protein [Bdellovibrionota bacterium]